MTGDVVVYLKDGRAIDISDRPDPVAYLRALGVTLADIDRTVHRIRSSKGDASHAH